MDHGPYTEQSAVKSKNEKKKSVCLFLGKCNLAVLIAYLTFVSGSSGVFSKERIVGVNMRTNKRLLLFHTNPKLNEGCFPFDCEREWYGERESKT